MLSLPILRPAQRLSVVVACATLALLGPAVAAPDAQAQEAAQSEAPDAESQASGVAELIARVSDVAQRVSAKNEEVKGLEDTIGETEAQIGVLTERADAAQKDAEAAAGDVVKQQRRIDELAQSRYRGDAASPVTAAIKAADPAAAVERLGYLGALSKTAQRNLRSKTDISAEAKGKQEAAAAAVKAAQDKRAELDSQRERLLKEKEDLERQKQDIEAEVDALNAEQRALWVSRFGAADDLDLSALADGSGSAAVQAALSRIGAPYDWGATGPDRFDCSGLMAWSYQQMGKSIPRTSQAQLAGGIPVPVDQLQPGDIVGYYPGVTHVGMYIGEGKVVHASTYGVPVQVVPVDSMPIQGASRY